MSSRKHMILLMVLGLIGILNLTAGAQVQTEPVVSSNIIRVWLPSGAERILPDSVPAELTEMIEKVVAGQGKFKRYETQVLIWKGAEFKKKGSAAIIRLLTERIAAAEWRFETGETANGVTVFRADEGATGKIVVGFYLAAGDGLLWAWAEVYAG